MKKLGSGCLAAVACGVMLVRFTTPAVHAGGLVEVGMWDSSQCPTGADVWGEGDYGYWGHFFEPCVSILDVSDPANPTLAAEYTPPSPNQFASTQEVKVHNGIMYIGLSSGDDSVDIVDVRDPTNPTHLAWIDVPEYSSVHNLFYEGGYLYLADSGTPTMGVVDLTNFDPDNPPGSDITTLKWYVQNIGNVFVHDMTVQNGRAYVCAWDSGLYVYDVTDVATTPPVYLGDSGTGNNTHAVWPTDDGKWAVVGEERTAGPIKLYEITEDGDGGVTVTLRDEAGLPDSSHNPLLVGDRCYTSWYGAGVRVHTIDRDNGLLIEGPIFDSGDTIWGVYPFLGAHRILASGLGDPFFVLEDTEVMSAPALAAAASVNEHTGLGELDIDIDIAATDSGDVTTEPREPGVTTLALTFASELDASVGGLNELAVNVTSDPAGAIIPAITTSLSVDNLTLFLDFAEALPDEHTYTFELTDDVTTSTEDRDFSVRALIGNVVNDAGAGPQIVNAVDIGLTGLRGHFSADVTDPANTRFDVTVDGVIDALDFSFVRLTGGVFGHEAP